jgi:hypothetical protein
LLEEAVAFIRESEPLPSTEVTFLRTSRDGKFGLAKTSATGEAVGLFRTGAAMWEGQVREELVRLLQEAVDEKRRKLGARGIRAGQALLLLYDAFGYADPEIAVAALRQVSGYD